MTAALLVPASAFAQGTEHFINGIRPWDGKPARRGPVLLQRAMLDVHNAARRSYGVAPLKWNAALADSARGWAAQLAARRQFAHDPQKGIDPSQGENLYRGTRGAFSYAAIAQLWVDERRDFRPGRFPDVVASGAWQRVGHYTQIIWPATREVGCALSSDAENDFLVCRYAPAGNYYGVTLK